MSDDLFKKILLRWQEYESNHIQIQNKTIFQLLDTYGKQIFSEACKESDKISYQFDDNGISVDIITDELVIIPSASKELFDLVQLANICFISPSEDHMIHIYLWFNGKKWVKKTVAQML